MHKLGVCVHVCLSVSFQSSIVLMINSLKRKKINLFYVCESHLTTCYSDSINLSLVRRELVLLLSEITTGVKAAKCHFLTCESICRTKSFVCLFVCLCVCVCFLYFWNILESILLLLFLLNSLFSVESNIHMVNSYSSKLCQVCAILKLNICYFILLYFKASQNTYQEHSSGWCWSYFQMSIYGVRHFCATSRVGKGLLYECSTESSISSSPYREHTF